MPLWGLASARVRSVTSASNLYLQSEVLDTAPWTTFQAGVIANATMAPDGTMNADKLI